MTATATACFTDLAADAASQRADIGMVFQNFNLFLHRTVLGNIEALIKGVTGCRRDRAMERSTRSAHHKADAYPVQLSGGQYAWPSPGPAMDPKLMLSTSRRPPWTPSSSVTSWRHARPADDGDPMWSPTDGFAREVLIRLFMDDGAS